VVSTVVDQAKKTVVGLVESPYTQYEADKQCLTSGANCTTLLSQINPGFGLVNAVVGRGSEIYGDFAHGRSAEGTGKLVFDAFLLFATRGAGEEVEAEASEARIASEACSFAPATPVLLTNGKTKPIGAIKPGDKVEAADPKSGKHQGARTVQHVWINHDNDLLDLTIRTKHGHTATLHTTANHPFWNDTIHTWVAAGKLHQGDALNTVTNGHAYVVAAQPTPGSARRWNLTVQELHTYYVVAGGVPILVHNSGGPSMACSVPAAGGPGEGISRSTAKALSDAGVPHGTEPLETGATASTTKESQGNKQLFDENYQTIFFPEEFYLTEGGEIVVYQDHYTGHSYGAGGVGDQPPHVHVRPYEEQRNGIAPGAQEHYYYDPSLG